MTFDLTKIDTKMLDELSCSYEEHGFCVLSGLKERVTHRFHPYLQETLGITDHALEELLDPRGTTRIFPQDTRQRLARVATGRELANSLIGVLQPVLSSLIGPLVHVSSTFHAQFKGGSARPVDHGGYDTGLDYMEVHGPYLLHQDFSGASFPTSPCALTLWVGLNECPDWTLRLYPGSHRLGLLCNRWLPLDHPGLAALGKPVNIQARPGTAVIFNSLLLHGTGEAGELRRVSCDIRFFPGCAFLPTEVHSLTENPRAFIEERLDQNPGPTRRAPLMEDLVLSGAHSATVDAPPFSILNWSNYLRELYNGNPDRAASHLERFTNAETGVDGPEAYLAKFHGSPMHRETLRRIQELMAWNAVPAGRA